MDDGWGTPSKSPAAGSRIITIGRLPENDVVLNYPMVSGRHARVTITNGQAEIEDLGSDLKVKTTVRTKARIL